MPGAEAATVEAAEVRNRCGQTSTPTLTSVVALIARSTPSYVIWPPVDEGHRNRSSTFFRRLSAGRYVLRYFSIQGSSDASTFLSSPRFSLVSVAGNTIHQSL